MGALASGGTHTSAPGGNGAPAPSGGTHTGIGPSGTGAPENGAPAPGRGAALGSAPRAPGSADPSHMGVGAPGLASCVRGTRHSLTGPGGSTRPRTGFFVLPHATNLTPTPLRCRTPLNSAGCMWARSRRGFKHCHPWRTPRLCRGREPPQPWSRSSSFLPPRERAVAARLPLNFHVRNPNGATA